MMAARAPKLIPSGIEPVDKLLGGLESGQLYLVHGEASGKSLFGIKFLIEGLKRGENAALVIRYCPEDAVRRFARLGYDCIEDVYSGRLVILEYSNEIIEQIARLRALEPVLRELEWLLGETRPQRLIFDPVAHLVAGDEGNLETRAREFAAWARSFGATVALVANGESEEVINHFKPLVRESFRFEVQEVGDRATRVFVFEKSDSIPAQAIEVDPSRGVFLLARPHIGEFAVPKAAAPLTDRSPSPVEEEADNLQSLKTQVESSESTPEIHSGMKQADIADDPEPLGDPWSIRGEYEGVAAPGAANGLDAARAYSSSCDDDSATVDPDYQDRTPANAEARSTWSGPSTDFRADFLNDFLDELADPSPLCGLNSSGSGFFELEVTKQRGEPKPAEVPSFEAPAPAAAKTSVFEPDPEERPAVRPSHEVGASHKTKSELSSLLAGGATRGSREGQKNVKRDISTAEAVEILLRSPESSSRDTTGSRIVATETLQTAGVEATRSIDPRDFNVLVIDDDVLSCDAISHALGEYTTEMVHDGVSGLAKLISFKPDLVILNVDLPIIDGFKILAHIRSSLNMPIIVVSAARMRASDRLLSTELGADYYLTKPLNVKELQYKARQLIARYHGIGSWITTAPAVPHPPEARERARGVRRMARSVDGEGQLSHGGEFFIDYGEFVARVEKGVKTAIEAGASFSIVGCRVSQMTSDGGRNAIRLLELIHALVRDTDVISTNPRNDIVVLLTAADGEGAQSFAVRLQDRVSRQMNLALRTWVRTFPEIEPNVEGACASIPQELSRRVSDRRHSDTRAQGSRQAIKSEQASTSSAESSERPDRRASVIDLLEPNT